jgi:hypothetical protein
MTREEIDAWVRSYVSACINEELPAVQGIYTFGPYSCGENSVLLCEPEVIDHGRKVTTIPVDDIVDHVYIKSPTTLDASVFAIYCSEVPQLAAWHSWNVERGTFSL